MFYHIYCAQTYINLYRILIMIGKHIMLASAALLCSYAANAATITTRTRILSTSVPLVMDDNTYTVSYIAATEPYGAALLASNSTVSSISRSVFLNNNLTSSSTSNPAYGGAITLLNSSIIEKISYSSFKDNTLISAYSTASGTALGGGAIMLGAASQIRLLEHTLFENNSANGGSNVIGGAIALSDGKVDKIANSTFKNNFITSSSNPSGSVQGGAIYVGLSTGRIEEIVATDFIANYGKSQYSYAVGGAIAHQSNAGIGTIKDSNLKGNYVESLTDFAFGGALAATQKIDKIINTTFSENHTLAVSNSFGGALYLTGVVGIIENSNMTANYAEATSGGIARGGAIYNNNPNSKIKNSSFYNNYAKADNLAQGGAILSISNIAIEADNGVSIFKGNYVEQAGVKTSNAIHLGKTATLSLNSINNGKIVFHDGINGAEGYKIVISGDESSIINFNANIKNADISQVESLGKSSTVNFHNAEILNNSNKLALEAGTANILNFGTTNLELAKLSLNGGVFNIYNLAVDLAAKKMGTLSALDVEGDVSDIRVKNINVSNDGKEEITNILFTDKNLIADKVMTDIVETTGPIFKYTVEYNAQTGEFSFIRGEAIEKGEEYNPVVMTPSIAMAAANLLSNEIYSRVLTGADTACNGVSCSRGVSGAWVKAFGANDDLDLKNFHSASANTQFSGIIGGIESERINEGKGISAVYNVYAAYAEGQTDFTNEKFEQQAGYVGVSANFYKDNLFFGTTANAGILTNKAKGVEGTDKFDTYIGGVAMKTGYNYAVSSLTLQPSLYASYTYVNSENYRTSRGADIEINAGNNFELAPGLKLIKDFDKDFSGYLTSRYVWNFYSGQDIYANNFSLPEINIKPYVEYGIGINKDIDNYSAMLEITRRDGGREGWNGLVGLKYKW